MRPHLLTREAVASRAHGGVRLGWVVAIFLSSLALVACLIVAAAWVLGGRAAPSAPTVQELLPRQDAPSVSGDEATTVSGLQPPVGTSDEYVVDDVAAILPGARESSPVKEIPVESVSALKQMGWVVPYLSRHGYEHQYVETTSLNGVRTIQARLTDGEHYINVAETRREETDVELEPLGEKLHSFVNLETVIAETVELTTGHEASLYLTEEESTWTSAIENSSVQYVITSDLPTEFAGEISSWVLITDRSRVQMLPSSPDAADRLERGFEELISLID